MYYWTWRYFFCPFLFRIALWILPCIVHFCIINVSSYGNKDLSLCADWIKWNATSIPNSYEVKDITTAVNSLCSPLLSETKIVFTTIWEFFWEIWKAYIIYIWWNCWYVYDWAILSLVIYSGAIIVQEERLRFATKRFPSFFQRAMTQLSLGIEYLIILVLNDSWREIWRRYELMRRSQLNQRDCTCLPCC